LKPIEIRVKLLVDDAERRSRKFWEPLFQTRLEKATEWITEQVPVQWKIVAVEEWETDPTAVDMENLAKGFARVVKPEPADVALGFTSRLRSVKFEPGTVLPLGVVKAAWQPHILIREGELKNEADRIEVLAHFLAQYCGATLSADPNSILREKVGDGRANNSRLHHGIDALNALAMAIWVEERQSGRGPAIEKLSARAQARLGRVYGTMHTNLPKQPLADWQKALMTKAGIVIEVPEPMVEGEMEPKKPVPEVPPVKPAATPVAERDLAAKKVVKAIAVIAEVNGIGDKLRGEALTELYLRTAADVASHEDPKIQAAAFNLGIGIALDDSDMLRSNRLTADLCRRIESDAERAQR
ncbi:MAG: hypothetical protein ACRCZF_06600, partial [Gemmataceae bacterium]